MKNTDYNGIIGKALSIQNSQNVLNLDFSNRQVNYKTHHSIWKLIYGYIPEITVPNINIDFSKNNMETEFSTSCGIAGDLGVVVWEIMKEVSKREKIHLTINFKGADISVYTISCIIENMKDWYANLNMGSISIKLNNGDIVKNTMPPKQLDIFAMFQYIKYMLKGFGHINFRDSEIYVGGTKIKISYHTDIRVKPQGVNYEKESVLVKGIYINLGSAYGALISDTKHILRKTLDDAYNRDLTFDKKIETSQSDIANLIADFVFENPEVLSIKDINVKIQNWKILEEINLGLQTVHTYTKLLKASTDLMVESVLKASVSIIQFKELINIYSKNCQQGYDQSDLYLLGISTMADAFYELYKGNYINGVTPFIMPIAIMSTTALVSKKYNNIVDESIKYVGYVFTGLSFGVLAENVYESYQGVGIHHFIVTGALVIAAIKLSTPVVIIAAITATSLAVIYKHYNDQQTTTINEKPKEMSGIIEDLSYQHDEF